MTLTNLLSDLRIFYNLNFNEFNLLNPFFYINSSSNSLTWKNYISEESFDTYEEYYQWVVSNNQYSLTFGEDALIRIHFKKKGTNWFASMAFLPDPSINSTYFRFDMDFSEQKDFIHSSYHIHFGYNSNRFRISLMSYPYPSQFLYFIAFLLGYHKCKHFDNSKFFPSLDSIPEVYNHFLNLKLSL